MPDLPVELTEESLEFFETKIRPLLVQRCYECHSAEADPVEGGLRIDGIQGLLALVMTARTDTTATTPGHRINLVDEDDAGAVVLGLLEQVANAAGTDADKHFHKI